MRKKKIIVFIIILFLIFLVIRKNKVPDTNPVDNSPLTSIDAPRLLVKEGGRVAWYKGSAHNLIAYDAVVNNRNKNMELFTIRPDGENKTCITCDADMPKGFIGQPDWHPNGEYIVAQVENEDSNHTLYNHPAWGINNDLWLIKRDGTDAFKIWDTPKDYAVLHPHFNKSGTKLIFAERVPTGKTTLAGKLLRVPGGENQWDGWRIRIADFNINVSEKLSNHQTIFDNTGGVYETHEFYDPNTIVYSHTAGGKPYVDDIYIARLDGTNVRNLTNSPTSWDEHGAFHPLRNDLMAFMSSRAFPWDGTKGDKAKDLQTELFLTNIQTGKTEQITDVNELLGRNAVISDFDWNAAGTQIVFQVASLDNNKNPELWIVDVKPTI